MWQWNAHVPGLLQLTITSHRSPGATLSVSHFHGAGSRPAILGDDGHVHAVQVHRVDHHPFVHEANAQLLAELRDDRLRRGKALAVEGVAVRAVVEDEHFVDVGLIVLASSPSARR